MVGNPMPCHIKKWFLDAYDIIDVGIMFLVSMAERNYIVCHFSMTHAHFSQVVNFVLEEFFKKFLFDNCEQVYWYMGANKMRVHTERTKYSGD